MIDDASKKIDERINELDDWRGKMLAKIRSLIKQADPDVVEEWKWAKATSPGIPVWSHHGIICTGEVYKDHLKVTFIKGASLEDPDKLFTQPGTVRRAIDFYEKDRINEPAFKNLIRSAAKLNKSLQK